MAAVARVVFVDGGCPQRGQRQDGGMMTQWHQRQWPLQPMVVATMVVVMVKCAAAVDAAATNPSLA